MTSNRLILKSPTLAAANFRPKAVCRACQDLKCSPKDCTKYSCVKGHECGHLAFGYDVLKNARNRGKVPLWKACHERQKELVKKLESKKSWQCNCKHRLPKGERSFESCHRRLHEATCALAPVQAGEQRWMGRNVGVTEEDLKFLAKRNGY